MGYTIPLASSQKPHAVCIPYPTQGHINPMLKLAKLLHHYGFHITFVNTEFNHNRLLKSRGAHELDALPPSFQYKTIPDGLPPPSDDAKANVTQDIPSLCQSTTTHCLAPFKDLLSKLNDVGPPVSCIVSDGIMSFTLLAAEEFGIPQVILWTTSACGFYAYLMYHKLFEKGIVPLKEASYLTNGYMDQVLDCIPGMKGIRLRDFPSFIRTTNPEEFMVHFAIQEGERARKSSAAILNTFEELEKDVLEALSSILPPIFCIGPLEFIEQQVITDESRSINLGSNLWKEDRECIEWLDTKEADSVVYVNFGSITVISREQLSEFAWGLANSKQAFLWIIRPDLVTGDSTILPPGFLEETKERGLLAGWCSQEQVLNHPSVGGFLTHNGWNSTLESISSGVPMICWPFFAEQQTNCWYTCTQWGVGMEIDSDVKRDEIERLVKELMVGKKGIEMKGKAAEWKKKAEDAAKKESGSSTKNLHKLIKLLQAS